MLPLAAAPVAGIPVVGPIALAASIGIPALIKLFKGGEEREKPPIKSAADLKKLDPSLTDYEAQRIFDYNGEQISQLMNKDRQDYLQKATAYLRGEMSQGGGGLTGQIANGTGDDQVLSSFLNFLAPVIGASGDKSGGIDWDKIIAQLPNILTSIPGLEGIGSPDPQLPGAPTGSGTSGTGGTAASNSLNKSKILEMLKGAIPALASVGGGAALAKLFGGPSEEQEQLTALMRELASRSGEKGLGLVDDAVQGLEAPGNYYSDILSGRRGAASSAFAPDIAEISSGYDNAKQNIQLQPRGGGRSMLFNSLPFKKAGDINSLFSAGRRDAAEKSTNLNLGKGGLGASLTGAATGGLKSVQDQLALQRNTQNQSARDMGGAIYEAMKGMGF